ncbi:MAG: PAS domain-containing sensor histidine kinase [Verrucomicrobiota bacterium]
MAAEPLAKLDSCGPHGMSLLAGLLLATLGFCRATASDLPVNSSQDSAGGRPGRIVTSYALTAPAHQDPNDHESSTPTDWRLLGSNDAGRTWQTVDTRTNEIFPENNQRRVFRVTNQASFNIYRLDVTRVKGGDPCASLAELEFMGPITGLTNKAQLRMKISSSRANPFRSSAADAFDGDPATDWYDFGLGGDRWIQCEYVTNADLVVETIAQLSLISGGRSLQVSSGGPASHPSFDITAATNASAKKLVGYSLTSANDFPTRDPADWQLLGSNDGGKTWDVLDVRRNESFPRRLQRRDFTLQQPAAYAAYRLQVDSVFMPEGANSVQLAEVEPHWAATENIEGLSLVVSAQGENPPWEVVQCAFDGDSTTKWLDYSAQSTNRASWIQWQFAAINGPPVLAINELHARRPRDKNPSKLDLQAVIVGHSDISLSLVDRTGFTVIRVGLPEDVGSPGDRVHLTGDLEFAQGTAGLVRPQLTVLGPLRTVAEVQANQPLPDDYVLGAVEGDAGSLTQESGYSAFRLSSIDGASSVQVRLLDPRQRGLPNTLNCRLRVQGIVEAVTNESGRALPGFVWVPTLSDVALLPPTNQDWNQWPEYSLKDLDATNFFASGIIRVAGMVDGQNAPYPVLMEGAHRLRLELADGQALPRNSRVEAAGFLVRGREGTFLRWAVWRPEIGKDKVPGTAVDAGHPVTKIAEVKRLRSANPGGGFPVRLRGVITYINDTYLGDDNFFYLQDGTNAIPVLHATAAALTHGAQQVGMYVELNGTVTHDGIEPTAFVRFLGKGRMPDPIRNPFDATMAPQNAGRWTQAEGVVSGYDAGRLTLLVDGKEMAVWVNQFTLGEPCRVPGSRLRVSGVCDPVLNDRDQVLGSRLLVPAPDCIEMIEPGPANPFLLPKVLLASILISGSGAAAGPMQMIRTEGIVTYKAAQMIFVQDQDTGARVFLQRECADIEPGDRVEVAGLALPDGFSAKLVQAQVRKVGRGVLPDAGVLDFTQAWLQSGQDALRAQVDAVLEHRDQSDSATRLELRCDATKRDFFAYLPAGTPLPSSLLPGARLRLKGVIKLQIEEPLDANQLVSAFEMYLNSQADIQVLAAAPWWTTRNTLWALAGLAAMLVISIAWISLLRSQVRLKTAALEQEVAERKQTQKELARERDLLRFLMDHTPDLIFFKDRESRVTECSKSYHERVGLGRQEVLGKTDASFLNEASHRKYFEDEQAIIRTGNPLLGTVEQDVTNDGKITWLLSSKMPLRDNSGAIIGTFGIAKDITAIKAAEAEMEQLHRQLVDASRKAGMAEVAAGVLHNVGNVLNSVNISTTLVFDTVTNSKTENVGRLAALIRQNSGRLADFFASDSKGKQIPAFLESLSAALDNEQQKLLSEMNSIRKNIEYIKEIVMMQQSYATYSGMVERVNPTELIEDALRMKSDAVARHQIQIIRDFPPQASFIIADRHKILQILINLIRNAQDACDESRHPGRAITLELRNGGGRVKFSVRDNGVGIPKDNLSRIFSFGFTTKPGGHGFGLHSGALAAREMGGALTVHSGGPGAGARFVLDLPVQPSSASQAQ